MENRDNKMTGVQKEMENLLKSIGASDLEEDHDDRDKFSSDDEGDQDDSNFAEESYLEKDAKSLMPADLSIFGAEGQLLYQDIVDGDLTEHDDVLNTIFQQSKAAARLHLIQIKQRLISERESALQTSERHNLRSLQLKNDEIEALHLKVAAAEAERDRWEFRFHTLKDKIPPQLVRSRVYYTADFSISKIFKSWKESIIHKKKEIQLDKFAVVMERRSKLSQTLATINRENAKSRVTKIKADHKVTVDRITKEIVESYENELNRLRSDAVEAHSAARHEQLRRKQLEEDLRRMLLKNMTAMNFEALSLFQHTTVPSYVEQQQSMSELKEIIANTGDISCIEGGNKGNTPGTVKSYANTAFTSNTNISRRPSEFEKQQLQRDQDEEAPRQSQPQPSSMGPPRVILGDSNLGLNPSRTAKTGTPMGIRPSSSGSVTQQNPVEKRIMSKSLL